MFFGSINFNTDSSNVAKISNPNYTREITPKRVATNEWRDPSAQLGTWPTQLRRNVAAVNRWRHCDDSAGMGIELQICRTDRVCLTPDPTGRLFLIWGSLKKTVMNYLLGSRSCKPQLREQSSESLSFHPSGCKFDSNYHHMRIHLIDELNQSQQLCTLTLR